MVDDERVARVLDQLPGTNDPAREVSELSGGLTNTNLKVTTAERTLVVRLFGEADLLDIDRDAEHENTRRAAESGAGPGVVAYLPDERALVIDWVEGRTWEAHDLTVEDNLVRVAAGCRQLHAGPRFVGDFDMATVQRRYQAIVREHGFRVPARYFDFAAAVDRVTAALAARPAATVPCNNDLLAANFIDASDRLWIIDYEYAGNNDACFELGNIWSEASLPPEHLDMLVGAYIGRHVPSQVARARLHGLLSKYGWTLWASIQAAASPIDFDFWEWGMEKYDRAVAEFDGPDFARLLDEAADPD